MLVMFDVTDPERVHTTTKGEGKAEVIDLKGLLARDEDFVRAAVEALVQAALEAEMTEAIGAEKGEPVAWAHDSTIVIWIAFAFAFLRLPSGSSCEMPALSSV